MPAPRISVIIVSWNVADLLRRCLSAIADHSAGLDCEIIVVDSASTDDTVAMVQRDFPGVHLIPRADNVGFPRGNNLGLAHATGDYLVLLNPDTEVVGDALATLVACLRDHPDVGLVGPELLNSDGSHQSSRRRFPTTATLFFESTWLQPLAPRRLLRRYYAEELPSDAAADVDWVTGACMATRRDVVHRVGGMDEAYFMYSEELDWCRRIKAAGWRVRYLPAAQVIHHAGKSSEQAVTARHVNFNRARLRYTRLYHGRLVYAALRGWLLLGFAGQIAVEGAKWVLGHKRPLRRQRIASYRDVLRTGLKAAGE